MSTEEAGGVLFLCGLFKQRRTSVKKGPFVEEGGPPRDPTTTGTRGSKPSLSRCLVMALTQPGAPARRSELGLARARVAFPGALGLLGEAEAATDVFSLQFTHPGCVFVGLLSSVEWRPPQQGSLRGSPPLPSRPGTSRPPGLVQHSGAFIRHEMGPPSQCRRPSRAREGRGGQPQTWEHGREEVLSPGAAGGPGSPGWSQGLATSIPLKGSLEQLVS